MLPCVGFVAEAGRAAKVGLHDVAFVEFQTDFAGDFFLVFGDETSGMLGFLFEMSKGDEQEEAGVLVAGFLE